MATMPKKPPLTIVTPDATTSEPPRPLGRHGTGLWCKVMSEYRIDDAGGIELLAQACGALDRVEALGERIAEDGEIIYGKAGPKAHPALKEQLAARAFLVRTLQKLGLNVEVVKPPGRPGGTTAGWRPD